MDLHVGLHMGLHMSLIDWFSRSASDELDRRVAGHDGTAQARFALLDDDAELVLRATFAPGNVGVIHLHADGAVDEAALDRKSPGPELVVNLGPGRRYRAGKVTIDAQVKAAPDPSTLASLTVEMSQLAPENGTAPASPLGRDSFSIESRLDAAGNAQLTIVVAL